ncbi:hypothetical protein EDC04DRAFT_2870942 [Pisolithus marmoratus]|nr:hypothetical protein EDC04DRAFT_2870942 [Pisolithus marmoratus]
MIVVLNGFPGTGKYAILKLVQALLPTDKSCGLVDNHLLIHLVHALFPERSDSHHDLRHNIRELVFPYISRVAQEGHVVLMTVCLAADNDRDAAFFRKHLALVRGTDVPLYWDQRTRQSVHRLLEPEPLSGGLTNLVVGSLNTNEGVDESARLLMKMTDLSGGAGTE